MLLSLLLLPTTWVVDANNGPGTDFVDLGVAISSVAAGDTLIIRSGSYPAVFVDKSLTLRGVDAATTSVSAIAVSGALAPTATGPRVEVTGLTLSTTNSLSVSMFGFGDLFVADCELSGGISTLLADVTIVRSELHGIDRDYSGGPGLEVASMAGFPPATLVAHQCTIHGGHDLPNGPNPSAQIWYARPALVIGANTRAQITACDCFGGDYSTVGLQTVGGDAVLVDGGALRIAGDGSTTLQAGGGTSYDGFAVRQQNGGAVTVHDQVNLLPASPGGTLTSPGVVTGEPELPRLSFTGTTLPTGELDGNQPVQITYDGLLPSMPFFFVFGTAPTLDATFDWLLLGELTVDLASAALVVGALDAQGGFAFSFTPAASLPSLLGARVAAQAGTFDLGLLQYRVSNLELRLISP
ncbi:MAG: hypothetical protein H6835_17440 [Planctomycetes bacterium]|nr:hypothetical protein [Planctomycetota bacterium]